VSLILFHPRLAGVAADKNVDKNVRAPVPPEKSSQPFISLLAN
jgi:hypothetical protein